MSHCGPHRLQQPGQPSLNGACARAGLHHVYVLSILTVHACGILCCLAILLAELELGHAVEELGEVAHNLNGLCPLGQDVQQVSGGDEVEAGEGQPFRLQVVG